jgi:hypothetical protein
MGPVAASGKKQSIRRADSQNGTRESRVSRNCVAELQNM